MNNLSTEQQTYLTKHRRHKRIVRISRVLILLAFLLIWELTARAGIIDSFIFSSPTKIALCFFGMLLDKSIFLHLGVTLYETLLSFLLVIAISILVAVALWFSSKLSEILDPYLVVLNSLPKSASDRMARRNKDYHHRRRDVGRHLRKHSKPLHQFHRCRPG